MTWLDKMNALQKKLIDASPITIGDELVNAVNLFRNAHAEVLQNGSVKLHLSPFWAEAGFVLPPVNSTIINYMLLKEIADREGVPVTWLYMLPYSAAIDSAARFVSFNSDDIMYVNDDGNATPTCLMAYHDGVEANLIDEDEPFIFANTKFTESYINSTKEVLQDMAEKQGLTFEMVLEHMSPTHIDSPFPYENDDSHWGDV
jgi:hypothetical protein